MKKNIVKKYNDWLNSNLLESAQFSTSHDEIKRILNEYDIENYSIKPDGVVDVDGDVYFASKEIKYFPVKFGIVKGAFDCGWSEKLKSLGGAPKECVIFNCARCNSLKSLEGAPKKCRTFYCNDCKRLESLKGAPEECETFWCNNCKKLEYSLEYFPRCKTSVIFGTSLGKLYHIHGSGDFTRLINAKTDFEFEGILADLYERGIMDWNYIYPLLKNKKITLDEFRHKHRGFVAGIKFNI